MVDILGGGGALSFSLNESIIGAGKVWPFSHMSRSFLIFSYRARPQVSYWSSELRHDVREDVSDNRRQDIAALRYEVQKASTCLMHTCGCLRVRRNGAK